MSRRARVTFNYDSTENDELDLLVGQIIENVTDEDEGWCKGSLDGKTGVFPNNFVEFIAGSNQEAPTTRSQPSKDSDAVAGKKAKVTFDYDALNEDELSLNTGSVVDVIREVEDGWWEGRLNSKTGVFPCNFVELIKEDEAPPLPPPKEEVQEPAPDEEDSNKRASIFGQAKKMGGGMGFGNIISAGILSGTKLRRVDTKPPKKEPEPEARPQSAHFASNPLVSPLKKTATSSSIKRKAPPAPLPATPAAAAVAPPATAPLATAPLATAPPATAPPATAPPATAPPATAPPATAPLATAPLATAPAPAKKVEKAKALFDYEKQNDDELNLVVGDTVTILNKEIYDTDGWWEGELNGRKGLFPDNFVELLPEEEEAKDQREKQLPKLPPTASSVSEKRTPPPLPDEASRSSVVEPNKQEMQKASGHESPKLPVPKRKPKPNNEFIKPSLPIKKPVPPKPSTKPSLPSKKPLPKPPTDYRKDIPPKPKREDNFLKSSLRKESNDDPSEDLTPSEDCNLDVVTPHEPLKPLTTNRAGKQPLKRPPSTTRQSEGNLMDAIECEEIEEEEKKKPAELEPREPAWKREATEAREARKLREETAPPPVPAVKEKKIPPRVPEKREEIVEKRKSWLKRDDTTKKPEGASPEEVSSLRQEVTELRGLLGNIEKKMAAMERKHEERMKSLEKRLEKDIEQLTRDFDEERTNHARLKIEVDRLKKKLQRDYSSIDGDSSHA